MKYFVNSEWVMTHLNDENVRIIDCRFDLSNPKKGFESYLEGHIPGALYFDLEKDLSGPVKQHGGRHPLPDLNEFQDKLSAAGIDHSISVVVYDDQEGPFASRLLWLLSYLGHEKVFILNGGFANWIQSGYQVSAEILHVKRKEFQPVVKKEWLATMDDVKNDIHSVHTVIIDSRAQKRYQGIEEPIDKIAGHIPSAKNYFWKDVVDENGVWKDADKLKKHFSDIPKEKEIIVYCGSGVTATPNFVSLKEAGYENVKLYLGSWSDWISYENNPIEKAGN